eukprot:scaffold827_cov369-Prasinococcus_capsulatus_cf.AAC.7
MVRLRAPQVPVADTAAPFQVDAPTVVAQRRATGSKYVRMIPRKLSAPWTSASRSATTTQTLLAPFTPTTLLRANATSLSTAQVRSPLLLLPNTRV